MDDPKMELNITSGFSFGRLGSRICLPALALMLGCLLAPAGAEAQTAEWIWTPKATDVSGATPQGACYFRNKFTLVKPEQAEIIFAAGDEYELYINNRLVSKGESYGSESKLDVFSYVQPGVNLIAVKVDHHSSKPGLAMKVRVKEQDETRWRSLVTNSTWRTRVQKINAWTENAYNDMGWLKAKSIGEAVALGRPVQPASPAKAKVSKTAATVAPVASAAATPATLPVVSPASVPKTPVEGKAAAKAAASAVADPAVKQLAPAAVAPAATVKQSNASADSVAPAASAAATTQPAVPSQTPAQQGAAALVAQQKKPARFDLDPEFIIEQVLPAKLAGSMVAMEFNEFGKLLFSREGGPLMIADLSLPQNAPGRIRVYCDKVKSCGGILPINGEVYVTGDGPAGLALYRLSDPDNTGTLQPAKALFKFSGEAGDHGPHGLRLGPDAMIYMVLGNGSQVDRPQNDSSPYRLPYEGDVVSRLEDPRGHAVGVKAPGGTIVRCSLDGQRVETFAGGLRNATDLAFDANGQLFVGDSDNSADLGSPWYRPSMLFHVTAGAELGWRRGSGKFASHFVDVAKPVCQLNSGLPAGIVAYEHLQFPARFHGSMFVANRATGEIHSVRPDRAGASFTGSTESFLTGKNFDVTDLAVGEDGMLYIATGDRGSVGGLYRVRWQGEIPEDLLSFDSDLAKVIRHPQPGSSWARQNVAQLKITLGRDWAKSIRGVASEVQNPAKFRVRAMQLMVLYGPKFDPSLLNELATADDADVRAQVARLCAASGQVRNQQVLNQLLIDADAMVRCSAAEAMLSLGVEPDFSILATLLKSEDHAEALVARRLLERMPAEQWKDEVLTTDDKRLFIQGAVALAIAQPTIENAYSVLARGSKFMEGFVSDADFTDMLRAMQLALVQSNIDPNQIPGFVRRIGNEFPSGNPVMNLELARLLSYLKVGDLEGRLEAYFANEEFLASDKLAVAMQLRSAAENLTGDELMAVLGQLQAARDASDVGESYLGYVDQALAGCSQFVSADHLEEILSHPKKYVSALIPAFYHMPTELDASTLEQLIEVDKQFADQKDAQSLQVRLGIVALLAQSGDEASMLYLRKLWQREDYRRSDISIGLAQQPDGENWSYLVSTLPVLQPASAPEVLDSLKTVARKPRDVRHYRELIRIAETKDKSSARAALALLEHWSGQSLADGSNDRGKLIASWKKWCDQQAVTEPAASTAAGESADRR